MKKLLYLASLGCNKNLVDSEVMLGKLSSYTITNDPSIADIIIVNSCGFIEAAKIESINTVLELHEQRKKESLLIMSGCLSQRYKEELQKELKEVDIFTGVADYENIDQLINKKKSQFSQGVYLVNENAPRVITGSNYHAYIKIAEGCNQKCSFCAIPTFKGRLKSRTIDSIIAEIEKLLKKGFREFTLISQDSSSYGRDFGKRDYLIKLIEEIEKFKEIKSAKILYLYPSTTSFELIDKIASSSLFESYFDMPIQHISDNMLKIMKRGSNKKRTIELLEYMRKKGEFLRSAFIVGHPNESEKDFLELKEFLEEFPFDRVNIFEYSREEDTTSYNMEQLPPQIIHKRASILGEIAKEKKDNSLLKLLNKDIRVVIDGKSQESELLFSARATLWAPEIDGEILINDTNNFKVSHGDFFIANITQIASSYPIATLVKKV